jgi:hypothetical protein
MDCNIAYCELSDEKRRSCEHKPELFVVKVSQVSDKVAPPTGQQQQQEASE